MRAGSDAHTDPNTHAQSDANSNPHTCTNTDTYSIALAGRRWSGWWWFGWWWFGWWPGFGNDSAIARLSNVSGSDADYSAPNPDQLTPM